MEAFIAAEETTYDVVHANFFMSGWVGLQRRLALPLVMDVPLPRQGATPASGRLRSFSRRALRDGGSRPRRGRLGRGMSPGADLIPLYAADPARIDIVPCGFDAEELMPLERVHSREVLGWDQTTTTSHLLCTDAAGS